MERSYRYKENRKWPQVVETENVYLRLQLDLTRQLDKVIVGKKRQQFKTSAYKPIKNRYFLLSNFPLLKYDYDTYK